MKIVIAGAGEIGLSIAELLSSEHHDVTLIDKNEAALERATQDLDIAVRKGSTTNWKLLEEVVESSPDLFIALTDSDEVNLAACPIAKGLGVPQTVARVRNWNYLNQTRLDFGRMFAVDHFVCPELLAAQEIFQYLLSLGSTRTESYAHGAAQMRTIEIPKRWSKAGTKLAELNLPEGTMAGLIWRPIGSGKGPRRHKLIFPHGKDAFYPGDEVTVIGKRDAIEQAHIFFGVPQHRVASAIVMGGGLTGFHVAKTLANRGAAVRLVEKDRDRCAKLSEALPLVTVIHHDGTDINFLQGEKVDAADVVVVCTGNEETNVLISLLAQQSGCEQIVSMIHNPALISTLHELGIAHFVSQRSCASNRIMAIARETKVITSSSLYENRAKILEVKVSPDSKIIGIPLEELGPTLPEDFLFAILQNRGRTMIANGQRTLCPGDSAIVVTSPQHTEKILELF